MGWLVPKSNWALTLVDTQQAATGQYRGFNTVQSVRTCMCSELCKIAGGFFVWRVGSGMVQHLRPRVPVVLTSQNGVRLSQSKQYLPMITKGAHITRDMRAGVTYQKEAGMVRSPGGLRVHHGAVFLLHTASSAPPASIETSQYPASTSQRLIGLSW